MRQDYANLLVDLSKRISGRIYLVGGAVRDHLMHRENDDLDFVIEGMTEEEVQTQLPEVKSVGVDFPVFLMPNGDQIALCRRERKIGAGHKGFVCEVNDVTIEEDLSRRDFTMNAIALSQEGVYIDPFKGVQSILDKTIKHVSSAFSEDPLRVFRCARFAAKLGFEIDPTTVEICRELSRNGSILQITQERVVEELRKAMVTDAPWRFFRALKEFDALNLFFPDGIEQPQYGLQDEVVNFVSSCMFIDMTDLKEMQRRLVLPGIYLSILTCWIQSRDLINTGKPEDLLKAFQLMQRTAHRHWIVQIYGKYLTEIMKRAMAITGKTFPEVGEGPEMGEIIKAARLEVITELRPDR